MEYDEEKFPEPPELKEMGAPPLLIQIKYMAMLFTVAFIVALIFAIIFRLKDG
ncbi:MAG TPA: hypothetical protein VMU83_24175 [Hanamia sp.]|nr:hypothetical protein [Hanamia sp.]